eukprot:m.221736 g.221736  ORF g.221736 m.221736 type:complete len:77 (+) comp25808_c0_seq2:162-392(+)
MDLWQVTCHWQEARLCRSAETRFLTLQNGTEYTEEVFNRRDEVATHTLSLLILLVSACVATGRGGGGGLFVERHAR